MEEIIERDRVAVELVSRVQIRAVFSGLVVSAGVYAVCMGLSWAIGLSTFKPTADHARGLALGNIIWGAIAMWISLFFGGFIAALSGRSPNSRTGVLHGLVVWGASSTISAILLVLIFSGLLGSILQMTEAGVAPPLGAQRLDLLRQAAGVAIWLYWAGIVGGLITAIVGGLLGARTEIKTETRRIPVREPIGPIVPQHA